MTTHTKNQNSGHRFSERIARPRVLLLLAILAIGSLMLSFYLGTRYAATGPDPAVQAKTVIPVWAKVEERTVSEGLAIAGTTKAGETAPISARTNGEPVLVYQNQKPGNVLKAGDDVLAFQKALNSAGYATAQSGTVTEDTLDAVTRLHRAHLTGVPSEGVTSIVRNNYAILPGGSHTVTAVAAVGQLISDGNPIASVETSEPYVESSVELAVANKLKVGDRISLRTSTGSVEGTITSIGELQNDPSKGAAKSVRFSADDPSKLTPGQSASITSKGNTSTTLAVPTTAVRQDSQGTYVLVEKGGSSTSTSKDAPATERVNVEVLRTAGGYAAINANLSTGQKVLVS